MHNPIQIVPAVLASTKKEFARQIEAVAPLALTIQIDIADGMFVPHSTITIKEVLLYLQENVILFRKHTFDFHLMVKNWHAVDEAIVALRNKVDMRFVFVHKTTWNTSLKPKQYHGIVFSPNDTIDISFTKQFTAAQIMTVEPGKQGGSFLPENLFKINALRKGGYHGHILLDGGINTTTIPQVLVHTYTPDSIAVGSYLTTAPNTQENFNILNAALTKQSY